jgi:glycosyltransferase involved in cell wall biosynthesis
MPLVRLQLPNVTLVLAGANPHARVKALASKLNIVTGWVDDMRPWYASSRVFIAPMQIGTGLQNKLLEAMSMQLPAITSPLANSALGASADVQVLLGDTPEAYASHLVELLTNGSKAHQLALAGYTFVKDAYSWERATQKLAGLFA